MELSKQAGIQENLEKELLASDDNRKVCSCVGNENRQHTCENCLGHIHHKDGPQDEKEVSSDMQEDFQSKSENASNQSKDTPRKIESDPINSKGNQPKSEDPPRNSEGHSGISEDPLHTSGSSQPDDSSQNTTVLKLLLPLGVAAVVGGGAIIAAPITIAAIGFGTGGIAAGSLAAGMMASAATTGVGMKVLSALHYVGAAGHAMATHGLLGTAGESVGDGMTKLILWASNRKEKTQRNPSEGNEKPARIEKPCRQEVGVNSNITSGDTDWVIISSDVGIPETDNIKDTVEPRVHFLCKMIPIKVDHPSSTPIDHGTPARNHTL